MLSIEDIMNMWKKDTVIDEMHLDSAALETPKLHAKYIEILSVNKLLLKRREQELDSLLQKKWLWYNGKMSKAQIDELGWTYDPLDGLKVLKGDMEYFYKSDKDIQEAQAKVEYIKVVIETLQEIVNDLRWRHQTIKNAIAWRQFMSGG
jgi:hypothetical protein